MISINFEKYFVLLCHLKVNINDSFYSSLFSCVIIRDVIPRGIELIGGLKKYIVFDVGIKVKNILTFMKVYISILDIMRCKEYIDFTISFFLCIRFRPEFEH